MGMTTIFKQTTCYLFVTQIRPLNGKKDQKYDRMFTLYNLLKKIITNVIKLLPIKKCYLLAILNSFKSKLNRQSDLN